MHHFLLQNRSEIFPHAHLLQQLALAGLSHYDCDGVELISRRELVFRNYKRDGFMGRLSA
jgi:hypothetical protein